MDITDQGAGLSLAALEPSAGEAFRKVLVVDDDPAIRRLVSKVLESAGYEVTHAADGREALEAMRRQLPSFVITDWEMPVLNGAEFCRAVRRQPLPQYVYIVMLTGSCPDRLVEGLASGADDFITKPIQPQELLARMQAGARVLELESRLRWLAGRDPLTELLNRRTFYELAEQQWHRSCRHGEPLSCVMIDLDSFKKINDTYGHPAGDVVLRHVTGLLKRGSRKSDSLCRWGGEEFCALLSEADEPAAAAWAEGRRRAIAEAPCTVRQKKVPVTASFGVAQRDDRTKTVGQLLDLADQALLAAKRRGRNRVVTFTTLQSCPSPATRCEAVS